MLYPVAEVFHSIKGEGFWTGVPMKFIRLAGCTVGKVVPIEDLKMANVPNVGIGLEEIFVHNRVYLMPINGPKEHNRANVALCMEIQKKFPRWTLCAQLHKLLGVQ